MTSGLNRKKVYLSLFSIVILVISVFVVTAGIRQVTSYLSKANISSLVNEPVRGIAGDLWADIVLGKDNFSEVVHNSIVSNKFFYPRSVIVDRSSTPNHLYILDGSNSRIVGIKNIDTCVSQAPNCVVNSAQGDIVIGQPNFNSATCNGDSGYQNYPNENSASASTMCNLPVKQLSIAERGDASNMYVSPSGDLYVNDMENSRVLKYIRPFETDSIADDVWGQNDFSGKECNKGQAFPDNTTLCFGWVNGADANNNWAAGVEVDAQGNLWVADNRNHRVLRFPQGSHTADIVLGQTSFNSKTYGAGLNQLRAPSAVRVNSQGWVYVADYQNNRILRYKIPTTGASAEKFGPDIPYVLGLDWDPTQPGKIWAAGKLDHTVSLIDEVTGVISKTLGVKGDGNVLEEVSGSIGVDSNGNYYVGVPRGNYGNDVVFYPSQGPYGLPSKNLFDGKNVFNKRTASGLLGGSGVVIAGNQVIVQDSLNRILFWNDPNSLSNGKAADGVLEITDFSGVAVNTRGAGGPISAIKASNNYLYVARGRHDKPVRIEMYSLPLTLGEQPLVSYLSYPFNVLGGGQINIKTTDAVFWGLQPAADDSYLWVSHFDTNRVFRIRTPLTNPVVDVILGQNSLTGNSCNRGGTPISGATLDSLCLPSSLAMDKFNNLYVSDHSLEIQGNMRMLIFTANTIPTNNSTPIFAVPATYIKNNIAAWQPAFDANNRMVVGYNPYWSNNPNGGWFPGVYDNPLSNSSVPNSFLKDYSSMVVSTTFDANGNLYVGDGNRSRVLIYKQPFGILSTTTPTPTIVNTPTIAPTIVPTPTVTVTPVPTGVDTITPQVSITSPSNNATVSRNSTITIMASASDNVGVTRVDFYVNGALTCQDFLVGYACSWRVPGKPNETYTITARAFDAANNSKVSQITVRSNK